MPDGTTRVGGFLEQVSWLEPTILCNLKCDGCYRKIESDPHKSWNQVMAELDVFQAQRRSVCISIAGGPTLVITGVAVTLVPLMLAYFVGRKMLRMNPLMLLGAITGAMTSGGALSVINDQAKSTIAGSVIPAPTRLPTCC